MKKDVIRTSFNDINKNLDEILLTINQQVAELVEDGNYTEAKRVIESAEEVLALQDHVRDVKENLLALYDLEKDDAQQSFVERKLITREFNKLIRSKPHTSNKAIRLPILQALENLGGKATRKDLFLELEKVMDKELTEADWMTLPSDDKITVWQGIATHALQDLKKDGLILNDSRLGQWEITKKGLDYPE
jgi:hypothetical protein